MLHVATHGGSLRIGSIVLALLGVVGTRTPTAAQEAGGTTVSLTVSPSVVNFAGFGGRFGAVVARLSVTRDFTRHTGGEVSAFMLAPMGGATAIPGCVEGSACQTYSTPNAVTGILTSAFVRAGESGLRLSAGAGAVSASGGEGLDHRFSLAGLVGVDYEPRSRNRLVPTFALRVVHLASPIAGARQLLLPGIGFSF